MVLSLLDPAPPEGPVRVAALPLVNVRFRKALVRLRFSSSGRISPYFSKETGFGMSDVGLAGSKTPLSSSEDMDLCRGCGGGELMALLSLSLIC